MGGNRQDFFEWLDQNGTLIGFIIGAVFVICLIVTIIQQIIG